MLKPPSMPDVARHVCTHILDVEGVTYDIKNVAQLIKAGINHKLLEETAKLAEEAIDSLAKETDMSIIGKLMNDGWKIKRELADGVTDLWIDDIYNSSIKAGAFGGKLMGAGGGGFFMFIVPPEKQEEFKNNMKQIKVWVPFKFDMYGSQTIFK